MSNVEYRCPICGHRGFFPPNQPIYKCYFHTDTVMVQHEKYVGPNFAFKDEDEVNPEKTGVFTEGAVLQSGKTTINVVRDKAPEPLTEEEQLKQLRDFYYRLTEDPPDKRWGIPRLRKEIEDQEHKAEIALEMQEAEALVDDDAKESNSDFNYVRSE